MINNKIDYNILGKKEDNRIKYGTLFTGEVLVTPIAVNPNKEEYVKLKGLENIEDQVQDPVYKEIEIKNKPYTKVEFFASFNPNIALYGTEEPKDNEKRERYEENIVISFPVFISDTKVVSKKGDKIQVIDQHNQSAWIKLYEDNTVAEMVDKYVKELKEENAKEYYINKINGLDRSSVRHAFVGEVILYDTIFNMTILPPHNVKTVKDKDGVETKLPLNNFVLSAETDMSKFSVSPEAAEKGFLKVFNGDVSYIRQVLESDMCKNQDGSQVKSWTLLGVREKDGKYYQDCFTPMVTSFISSEFSSLKEIGEHSTHLSKEAAKNLLSTEYPWKSKWSNSFKFQVFDPSLNQQANSVEDDDGMPGISNDDDLPF
jgi:hypothetical protein